MLCVLLAPVIVASQSCAEGNIEFRFQEVEADALIRRQLAEHEDRASNSQCTAVHFRLEKLLGLIAKIDAGEVPLAQSTVLLHLPDSAPILYKGVASEMEFGRKAVWEGLAEQAKSIYAVFVVNGAHQITAYIATELRLYRLSSSDDSSPAYLCERKQRAPKKID